MGVITIASTSICSARDTESRQRKISRDESVRLRFFTRSPRGASLRHRMLPRFPPRQNGKEYFLRDGVVEGETLEEPNQTLRPARSKADAGNRDAGRCWLAAVHKTESRPQGHQPSNIMVSLEGEGTGNTKITTSGWRAAAESHSEARFQCPGFFCWDQVASPNNRCAGRGTFVRIVLAWRKALGDADWPSAFEALPAEVMHQHQHAPYGWNNLKVSHSRSSFSLSAPGERPGATLSRAAGF